MKKHLISILFALILGVIFCVSASAADAEPTKAEKWHSEAHGVTGIVLDYTIDDGYTSVTQRLYSKGDKAVSEVDLDGSVIRIIADSEDVIIFNPDMPIFHVKFSGLSEALAGAFETVPTEFTPDFVKSYEHTEGDKTYYIEEFVDDEGIIYKYYFIGDELIFIDNSITVEEDTLTTRMMIISYEVDDEIFEIPWYSINLYPIVMLITMFSII